MKKDWSKFTKRINVDSTTRAIYNAWAIPAEIERWFLASADYSAPDKTARSKDERVSVGDTYVWKWFGFPDGTPETGRVVEANGHDTFSFTFADECLVEVSVGTEKGEKVVQLTQSRIPPSDDLKLYIGCGEGWTFYLANLKSILEGGIDLRNRNDQISNLVNA